MRTPFQLHAMLTALTVQLTARAVQPKVSAIKWIIALHQKIPAELGQFGEILVAHLATTLTDPVDGVLVLALETVAMLSICTEIGAAEARLEQVERIYQRFIKELVTVLKGDAKLFAERTNYVIQQLAEIIPPHRLYEALANAIADEPDVTFAKKMIRKLNWILLTAAELNELREDLRLMEVKSSVKLFVIMYNSWCLCPIATLALCLLCQMTEHATHLLVEFQRLDFTAQHVEELER